LNIRISWANLADPVAPGYDLPPTFADSPLVSQGVGQKSQGKGKYSMIHICETLQDPSGPCGHPPELFHLEKKGTCARRKKCWGESMCCWQCFPHRRLPERRPEEVVAEAKDCVGLGERGFILTLDVIFPKRSPEQHPGFDVHEQWAANF